VAVVHGADAVDDATMLAFARETRLSETTFVQTADGSADYVNRIFTVVAELPFAGHPSLGTAVAVARERGDTEVRYVQRTHAGEQPIDVALDGLRARASMLQEPAAFGAPAEPAAIAAATGIAAADIDPALSPRFVSTGVAHLIVILRDAAALQSVRAGDPAELAAVLAPGDGLCVYLAAPTATPERWRARSLFLGTDGVQEDPATGSAAGPLLADLADRAGHTAITVDQGIEMGRPSVLDVELEGDRVRVSGDVFIVAEGTVHLP
jgi:trans-2,3-dihydro-3-hydroxyanthranilate isomerase